MKRRSFSNRNLTNLYRIKLRLSFPLQLRTRTNLMCS
jgi:hypothetical protein